MEGSWATLARGPLPGAGCWTHQYGEPGNSACGDDQRVRGDLGVLWYGEPGPEEMVNRHNSAVAPLAMDGRFFIQGERKILAYDAYNGLFLWEVDDPDANRQGTGLGNNPGNLAGGDGRIFVVAGNRCRELDAATGRELAVHRLPPAVDTQRFAWQYVAYLRGMLVGTAVQRREVVDKAHAAAVRSLRGTTCCSPSTPAADARSGPTRGTPLCPPPWPWLRTVCS